MFLQRMKKCFLILFMLVLFISEVFPYGKESAIEEKTWLDPYEKENHSCIARPNTLRVELKNHLQTDDFFICRVIHFGNDSKSKKTNVYELSAQDLSKEAFSFSNTDCKISFNSNNRILTLHDFKGDFEGFDLISNVGVLLNNITVSRLVRIYAPSIEQKQGTIIQSKNKTFRTESVKDRYEKAQENYKKQVYGNCVNDLLSLEADGICDGWIFHSLGQLYNRGKGIRKHNEKANAYFDKAIEKTYVLSFIARAMNYLANLHDKKSVHKALNLVDAAVVWGYRDGDLFTLLGQICDQYGYWSKATDYFQKGIKENNTHSFFYLGMRFYYGYGIEQNYKEARVLLKKAVKAGYEDSKILQILSEMY